MILELKDITKVYPGALALDQVSLGFEQGEIHALMGENGAGKSTLIKTISGAITPTSGRIIIDGHSFDKMTPVLSKQYGISIIYQDTNLVLPMSVAENIFLGTSQSKLFSKKKLCFLAQKIFDKYGFNLNPAVPVGSLSPANQQLVEVAKAISSECRIMIMDEPTAPLVSTEVELLFRIIRKLKKEGVTIIYISHRLAEVFEISDRISVLRDGHFIKTINTEDTDKEELISLMVGRKLGSNFPPRLTKPLPQVVLELDRVTGNSDSSISLSLHKGEILGIGGLVGSGRTELAEMICGSKKISSGQVFIKGKKVSIKNPSDAIRNGIGLIPEDRKKDGCII
ncbi:MAG: sugar ABC transporter ATP-binding protein, partial [Bacilli bacterium]